MSAEIRQRYAWHRAGLCPMCSHEDGKGWLCDTCTADVRKLPSHARRQWHRFMPPTTAPPIQGSGYTPAQLLGGVEDEPADGELRPSRYHARLRNWLLTVIGVVLVILAAWQLGGTAT